MYSTCLFCQASLEKNDTIEHFPIGRRLAFDAAMGRLWVVCRKCARWNLTPLEERWEALEECERAFSSTRLRVSTDHVGLARLGEGLELVRIGKPQRPEFAAWRYGDQFGRRRRKTLVYSGILGATALGYFATGTFVGPLLGIAAAGGTFSAIYGAVNLVNLYALNRVKARVVVPGEERLGLVRPSQLNKIRIVSDGRSWHLRMPLDAGEITNRELRKEVTIEGAAALRAAATILSVANAAGADKKLVRDAVEVVSETPDASELFLKATRLTPVVDPKRNYWKYEDAPRKSQPGDTVITEIPAEFKLALEMATNEDIERRAMEGELAMLEAAWRQAEEIAAIADNLDSGKPGDISARSTG